MKKALLIGCGHSPVRQVRYSDEPSAYEPPHYEVVKLDVNPDLADVVFDMEEVASGGRLPFEDESFDEIAAFNTLEHWGRQGDFRAWFHEFGEYHRILKDGGEFRSLTPLGEDRFADPGHTRFIGPNHFGFLCQDFYRYNREQNTSCADYTWLWKLNFNIRMLRRSDDGAHLAAILVKGPHIPGSHKEPLR